MTIDTQTLTDRIAEHLARPVRPPVYVEIVDPSGRVSYRRWSDHPDVQEALGTQGYTVRRCPQQPDLDGEAHPDRALLTEAQAELRAQAEALDKYRLMVAEWVAAENHLDALDNADEYSTEDYEAGCDRLHKAEAAMYRAFTPDAARAALGAQS